MLTPPESSLGLSFLICSAINDSANYVCCSVREQLGGKMVLERIETKPVLEGV